MAMDQKSGKGALIGGLVFLGVVVLAIVGLYALTSGPTPQPPLKNVVSQESDSFKTQEKAVEQARVKVQVSATELVLKPLLNNTASASLVVSNAGNQRVTISNIMLGQTGYPLAMSGSCQARTQLEPQASCAIDLAYTAATLDRFATVLTVEYGRQADVTFVQVQVQPEAPEVIPQPLPSIIQADPPPQLAIDALNRSNDRRLNGLVAMKEARNRQRQQAQQLVEARYPRALTTAEIPSTESTLPVDRSRIITQDRHIKAVLESTVQSGVSGRVTAVLESHVYSADGRNILLPAGTRAVGTAAAAQVATQGRIQISWTRMIRPDGVSISLENAQAADAMGRPGAIGEVDRRYLARFGVAMASSAINVASVLAIGGTSSTTFNGFQATNESDARARAGQQIQNDLAQITQSLIKENADLPPIVTIAGGTRIDILLAQDVYFVSPNRVVPMDDKGQPILPSEERRITPAVNLNPPADPQQSAQNGQQRQTSGQSRGPNGDLFANRSRTGGAPLNPVAVTPSNATNGGSSSLNAGEDTMSPQARRMLLPGLSEGY